MLATEHTAEFEPGNLFFECFEVTVYRTGGVLVVFFACELDQLGSVIKATAQ